MTANTVAATVVLLVLSGLAWLLHKTQGLRLAGPSHKKTDSARSDRSAWTQSAGAPGGGPSAQSPAAASGSGAGCDPTSGGGAVAGLLAALRRRGMESLGWSTARSASGCGGDLEGGYCDDAGDESSGSRAPHSVACGGLSDLSRDDGVGGAHGGGCSPPKPPVASGGGPPPSFTTVRLVSGGVGGGPQSAYSHAASGVGPLRAFVPAGSPWVKTRAHQQQQQQQQQQQPPGGPGSSAYARHASFTGSGAGGTSQQQQAGPESGVPSSSHYVHGGYASPQQPVFHDHQPLVQSGEAQGFEQHYKQQQLYLGGGGGAGGGTSSFQLADAAQQQPQQQQAVVHDTAASPAHHHHAYAQTPTAYGSAVPSAAPFQYAISAAPAGGGLGAPSPPGGSPHHVAAALSGPESLAALIPRNNPLAHIARMRYSVEVNRHAPLWARGGGGGGGGGGVGGGLELLAAPHTAATPGAGGPLALPPLPLAAIAAATGGSSAGGGGVAGAVAAAARRSSSRQPTTGEAAAAARRQEACSSCPT